MGVWVWVAWYIYPAEDFTSPAVLPVTVLRYVSVGFSPMVLQRTTSNKNIARQHFHPLTDGVKANAYTDNLDSKKPGTRSKNPRLLGNA